MLISMTEKWKQALGNGLCVGAMFIDFQKSFDNVSRPILSHKLQAIGIFDLGYIMIVVVRLQIKQLQIKPKKTDSGLQRDSSSWPLR